MKLGEFAKEYESQTTKNISDLKEVDVNLELEDREAETKEGKPFKFKVICVNGEEYRVPKSVIASLKAILEKKPTLKKFSVSRVGKDKEDTRYTVIPLE